METIHKFIKGQFHNNGQIASELNSGYFYPPVKSDLRFTNKIIDSAQLQLIDCEDNPLSNVAIGWELLLLLMTSEAV